MKRRQFSAQLAVAALGLPFLGRAHAQGAPVEGTNYVRLAQPVTIPPAVPGKVEVIEFFSYACPHCFAFEPTLEEWAKNVPPNIAFRRVPVPFLFNAENFQRIYYTLESMGLVEQMQRKVFNAVHLEHLKLNSPDEIKAFMAKNGIDANKFMGIFNSFSMPVKVRQAKQLADAYKIDGVPTLGIGGRFFTSPSLAGGHEQALRVVEFLAKQVR
jgi:thiol:disulfide interchange protein DsbA